jgi:hypothetical protein
MGFMPGFSKLDRATAPLKKVDDKNNQSDNQEDVNKTAHGVRRDHTEKPENAEHYKNRPKHGVFNLTRNSRLQCLWRTGEGISLLPE